MWCCCNQKVLIASDCACGFDSRYDNLQYINQFKKGICMKELAKLLVGIVLTIIVFFAVFAGLGLFYNKFVAPVNVELERTITINSSSFINGRNDTMVDAKQKILALRTEMSKLNKESDTYKTYSAQVKGLLEQMCFLTTGMNEKDITDGVVEFLNENGGC